MPTVCLNMIVKDEAAVIERCLASVRPFIDHWVIVDTGSTDGTQDIVRRHLSDIPGELHERPWKNFGHNRTEAIELARGKADYVFVMDADNIFCCPPGWRWPDLTADAYRLTLVSGETRYDQTLLVSDRRKWRWVGVLHEYLATDGPHEGISLPVAWVDRRHEGARSRDPNIFRKDAALLEEALLTEPDNARYVFYLGQSWRDAGELAKARDAYRRRAAMGGWDEEIWHSLFQVATLTHRLEAPDAETIDACLTAYQYRPTRAEPLVFLARLFELRKQWALSRLFAREAVAIQVPDDGLFLDQTVYRWQSHDALAVAEFWLGHHAEAFALNSFLLLDGDRLPEDQRARVEVNRDLSVPALLPQSAAYAPEAVQALLARAKDSAGGQGITLTIAFGGGLERFETAVNSVLYCFLDIGQVERFVCVVEGASDPDRERLKERYPFIDFISIDGGGEGRARVMNRLMEEVATPWWLHIEGDAHFFVFDGYLSRALAILAADPALGQVAFNRNYATTLAERALVGGVLRRTASGIRYVEHEYVPEGPERDAFFTRHPAGSLSNLWRPHFAFTSSLMRTEAMRRVGRFAEAAVDPEMDFARRYVEAGHKTAFFDAVTHIRNFASVVTPPGSEGPGVNLVQVSINEHKAIFDDLLQAMQAALEDLKVPVSRTDNVLLPNRLNVLVGASVFAADALLKAVEGHRFIVYQMEPLSEAGGFFPGNPAYVRLLELADGVWDYSRGNVAFLEQRGIRNVAWVRPGYHALLEKVPGEVRKSIDVLFVGAPSDRRLRVLAQLEAAGLSVRNAFKLYGDARNRAIAEAKIVLNIHQHANIDSLEEVRLSFLLANRCFVVSEDADWNPYGEGVVYAPYDRLTETCVRYIEAGDAARDAIAQKGHEAIRAATMKGQLEVALRSLAEDLRGAAGVAVPGS